MSARRAATRPWTRHGLAATTVLALAGSVAGAPALAADPSPSMASAAPSVTPEVTEVAPTVAWGPLAMVRDPNREQVDAGMEPGTIRINPFCVVIEGEAFATTLVFRDWQVIWRPSDETIVVADNTGELAVLADGDTVSLGGYDAWDEDAMGQRAAPPWLVQPGPDCPSDRFLVHSARVAD